MKVTLFSAVIFSNPKEDSPRFLMTSLQRDFNALHILQMKTFSFWIFVSLRAVSVNSSLGLSRLHEQHKNESTKLGGSSAVSSMVTVGERNVVWISSQLKLYVHLCATTIQSQAKTTADLEYISGCGIHVCICKRTIAVWHWQTGDTNKHRPTHTCTCLAWGSPIYIYIYHMQP